MKTICLTFCLLALMQIGHVFGAASFGIYKNDAFPGQCYLAPDLILSPGQIQEMPSCRRASCYENSRVTFFSCGAKAFQGESCTLGEQKYPDADYPKCCIKVLRCADGEREF